VRDGLELPVLTKGPVRVRHLAMFAAATSEFADIHYDRDYAQSMGLPDIVIQGVYKTATIAQMLKDWVGDGTALKRLNVQHRGMDVVGNTLTAGGKVLSVSDEPDGKRVECEVWVDNQHGQRTATGTAIVLLP
jgi:acyl dehydratase